MKGLEALEKLDTKINILDTEQDLYNYCLNVIEKELKALEIINKKNVVISFLKKSNSLENYNFYFGYTEHEYLTQKEYDLLKEVLE